MSEKAVAPIEKNNFSNIKTKIILWYNENGRDFPWRSTIDSFHILLAEMFLRRTTAKAVSYVYPMFIERYHSPSMVSQAHLSTLTKLLNPLGLQRARAQNIRDTSKILVKQYDGAVPAVLEDLLQLPGIGVYVANAVLNFAFAKPRPLVDGNVVHLLNRVFSMEFKNATDKDAWEFMELLGTPNQDKALYWGIIDLVALICLRRRPKCELCPLLSDCDYSKDQSKGKL